MGWDGLQQWLFLMLRTWHLATDTTPFEETSYVKGGHFMPSIFKANFVACLYAHVAVLLLMAAMFTPSVQAEDKPWYPFPVDVLKASPSGGEVKTPFDYVPLAKSDRQWRICVSFPHMKDSYWLAVNYGLVQEASRLGVNMRLLQAGGYDGLGNQIRQIRECVRAGTDAVVIGAISLDGLNGLVGELRGKGLPVIDLVNGMSSQRVSARSQVSFREMGFAAGTYIAKRHPANDGNKAKIAWFPGPRGAGWVTAGNEGFAQALHGSATEIVATRYGDTGQEAQSKLIEEELSRHPDLDYIAGTAVTAGAALPILRAHGLEKQVKVVSYYLTAEVYRGIQRGHILAAPTDSAVIQGRIAIDQSVRILQQQDFTKDAGPRIKVFDASNMQSAERLFSLAPSGFRPRKILT